MYGKYCVLTGTLLLIGEGWKATRAKKIGRSGWCLGNTIVIPNWRKQILVTLMVSSPQKTNNKTKPKDTYLKVQNGCRRGPWWRILPALLCRAQIASIRAWIYGEWIKQCLALLVGWVGKSTPRLFQSHSNSVLHPPLLFCLRNLNFAPAANSDMPTTRTTRTIPWSEKKFAWAQLLSKKWNE